MSHKTYEFPVVIEKDEDGVFVASVPSIPGCHSHAKTLPTLIKRIKEAIELCIEVQKTEITPMKFVGFQEVEVTLSR